MSVVKGSVNVFEDLGFEAEEAANLKVRADLMLICAALFRIRVGPRLRQRPILARRSHGSAT